MIITIILFLLSLLLEGVIPNLLSGFLLLFMLCVITLSSKILEKKAYYIIIFIFGVIFDLLYTSVLFIHGFIFLFLGYLIKLMVNKNDNFIKMFFTYILISVAYILIMIMFTFSYNNYDFYSLGKILLNSFVINVLYFLFIYMVYFVTNHLFSNTKNKKNILIK